MSLPKVTQFICRISPSKGEINQLILFSFYLFAYLIILKCEHFPSTCEVSEDNLRQLVLSFLYPGERTQVFGLSNKCLDLLALTGPY